MLPLLIDGNPLSTVPMSTAKDLDAAVTSAKAAFAIWSKFPIKERVQVFFAINIYWKKSERARRTGTGEKMEKPTMKPLPKLKKVSSSQNSPVHYPNW